MKNDQIKLKLLWQDLDLMHKAAEALERSWLECRTVCDKENYPVEEIDRLELLSSRFSRLADFMIQRIFRLIDEIDLESPGTVRDLINRAAKKDLIEDADAFIQARILRNKIAHEYVEKVMNEIFEETVRLVPMLFDAVRRVDLYVQRYQP
jgi:hypothetical protein